MSFFVNASQEEAFRLVMDYLKGRRIKTLTSNSPSYIKAEFGWGITSWGSAESGNARGEAEVNIVKSNGGSYVNLNFGFYKEWLSMFVFAAIAVAIVSILFIRLEVDSGLTLVVMLVIGMFVVAITEYSVSKTRKRFIEEFNMFIQSLATRKD